jgi:hypothetical protein
VTFQEQSLPTSVATIADLATSRARTANRAVLATAGFSAAGDDGGSQWIYNRSGRSLISVGPFFRAGPGVDDYFERVNKHSVTCYQAGASNTNSASVNFAALQAVASLGVSIEFPPGADIDINDELVLADGCTVYGYGWASKLNQTVINKNVIRCGHSCTVAQMHLIGFGTGTVADFSQGNGVAIIGRRNVTVSDCLIEQMQTSGVYIANARSTNIRDNILFRNTYSSPSGADIILYSSTADSGICSITNNRCYSNNSGGIYLNAQGYDSRITVTGNHCITLDPASCTLDGDWDELTDEPSIERRHGIIVGYGGESKEIILSANICKNTRWTGIYKLGLGPGPLLIDGNLCVNNGFDDSAGFQSGMMIRPYGGEIIRNNTILDCRANAFGAIYITGATPNAQMIEIGDNTIMNSSSSGIYLTDYAYNCLVKNNTIVGSAHYDIASVIPPGSASAGGHQIRGNTCRRTNTNYPSIILGIGDSTKDLIVEGNYLYGSNKATLVDSNAGIRVTSGSPLFRIRNNVIDNFNFGIYHYFYWDGRVTNYQCERNTITNCNNGIDASCADPGDAVLLLQENDLRTCTTQVSNSIGYSCGVQGRLVGTAIHAVNRKAPASGPYLVGDTYINSEPKGQSSMGWVCKTSGSPGTWERYGGNSAPVTSPLQLIGLEWWLDASDESTIDDTGGRVDVWRDKSGNNRELVAQAADTTRPITGATTINGLNVLDVTAGQFRTLKSALEQPLLVQPYQMFVVFNASSSPDGGRVVNGITLANRAFIWADGTWTAFAGYEDVLNTNIDSTVAGNYFISVMFNDTASKMWVNDNAPQAISPGYGNLGGLRVNGAEDNSGFHIDGSICEVIVTSFDNSENVEAMKSYLVAKWGLTF